MYAYSLNDPVNRFDPGGEIALTISVIYVVGVCVGVLGIGSLVIINGSILDNSTEKNQTFITTFERQLLFTALVVSCVSIAISDAFSNTITKIKETFAFLQKQAME